MKIVWNYVFILTGLSLFFQIVGIQIGALTAIFNLTGVTITSTGITFATYSPFTLSILAILALALAGAVKIGIFGGATAENYLIAPLAAGSLILYVSLITSVINYSSTSFQWIGIVVSLIMIPLGIGLVYGFIDWFRGGDF